MALRLNSRARGGALLGLALVVLWQLGIGQARPGSASCPAGEAGLCLALVAWWCGANLVEALAMWGVGLLCATAVTGVAPIWLFAVGCPAWLLVRALAGSRGLGTFLILAAGLVSGIRCGAKLLFLSMPGAGFPLTLSAATIPESLWAELAPNILFLLVFAGLMGAARRPVEESSQGAIRNLHGG